MAAPWVGSPSSSSSTIEAPDFNDGFYLLCGSTSLVRFRGWLVCWAIGAHYGIEEEEEEQVLQIWKVNVWLKSCKMCAITRPPRTLTFVRIKLAHFPHTMFGVHWGNCEHKILKLSGTSYEEKGIALHFIILEYCDRKSIVENRFCDLTVHINQSVLYQDFCYTHFSFLKSTRFRYNVLFIFWSTVFETVYNNVWSLIYFVFNLN